MCADVCRRCSQQQCFDAELCELALEDKHQHVQSILGYELQLRIPRNGIIIQPESEFAMSRDGLPLCMSQSSSCVGSMEVVTGFGLSGTPLCTESDIQTVGRICHELDPSTSWYCGTRNVSSDR